MLTTDRLRLRTWKTSDFEPFARMNADPLVMEHMPGRMTKVQSFRFMQRLRYHFWRHGFGLLAVETRDFHQFVGFVGLMVPELEAPFMPAVEIGWRLLPEYWGCGYATEAARAIVAYAFSELKLPEVVAYTVPANERSRRVMEKLGMTRNVQDDFEHPGVPVGNPFRPHVLYRLSKEQFAKHDLMEQYRLSMEPTHSAAIAAGGRS